MSQVAMSPVFPPGAGIHATAVVVGEAGILILGPSGSGKSALALALIARAREAGLFAALVGDDRVWLRAISGRLVAAGAAHMAGMIERRGVGIVTDAWAPEAVVRLAVDLGEPGGRPPEGMASTLLEGVETLRFPIDGRTDAVDNADATLERLRTMTKGSRSGKRILLEHCAALHKSEQLASSPADAQGQGNPKPG